MPKCRNSMLSSIVIGIVPLEMYTISICMWKPKHKWRCTSVFTVRRSDDKENMWNAIVVWVKVFIDVVQRKMKSIASDFAVKETAQRRRANNRHRAAEENRTPFNHSHYRSKSKMNLINFVFIQFASLASQCTKWISRLCPCFGRYTVQPIRRQSTIMKKLGGRRFYLFASHTLQA